MREWVKSRAGSFWGEARGQTPACLLTSTPTLHPLNSVSTHSIHTHSRAWGWQVRLCRLCPALAFGNWIQPVFLCKPGAGQERGPFSSLHESTISLAAATPDRHFYFSPLSQPTRIKLELALSCKGQLPECVALTTWNPRNKSRLRRQQRRMLSSWPGHLHEPILAKPQDGGSSLFQEWKQVLERLSPSSFMAVCSTQH